MNYYLAPLEGITGYIYRNAYHKYFEPMDKYYTPFLTPNQNRRFKSGELNDILPENNQGLSLVPQVLTNHAGDFLWSCQEFSKMGYKEINLNLGCPSKTVVTKQKGSGFLSCQEDLNRFLEEIFSKTDMSISIKTRIGRDDPREFYELIEIYNQYPVSELIIHPRIQTDYYKNTPNYEMFGEALKLSKNPVVYNGDLFTPNDIDVIKDRFPSIDTLMLGRGILKNPGFIGEYKNNDPTDKKLIKDFHDYIYHEYQQLLSGDRNVLFKMKEIWSYLIVSFDDAQKCYKKIKKSQTKKQYEDAVKLLFET